MESTRDSGRHTAFFKSTAPKLAEAFGRSFSPSSAPNDHCCTQTAPPGMTQTVSSPASPIPSISYRSFTPTNIKFGKDRPPPCPEVVSSILNSMYARPIIRQETSIPSTNASKVPFLHRKISRPAIRKQSSSSETSRISSEDRSPSKSSKSTIRTRTLSGKSMSVAAHEDQSTGSSGAGSSSHGQTGLSSTSDISGRSHRVVGRGGSGSRPRIVVFDDLLPSSSKLPPPKPKPSASQEQSLSVLRPSGRGGLASRPQALAPSPPLPKSPVLNNKLPLSHQEQEEERPGFIRTTGRGGLGSRPMPPGTQSSLLERLQKRKIKMRRQSKGKSPGRTSPIHPIPPNMAYRITNGSTSRLSTIHSAGEELPQFFQEDNFSSSSTRATHSSSYTNMSFTSIELDDDFSTPPFSATSSTFEGNLSSIEITPDDDVEFDNVYIEGTRPPTPTSHRQRTLDKLTRTLGEFPIDNYNSFASESSSPNHPLPRLVLDNPPSKTAKALRKASISMTSLFSRPSGRPRDSVSTLTNDLHMLNLGDNISELWGEARNSYSTSPGSPMIFSLPSPVPKDDSRPALLSTDPDSATECGEEGFADDSTSFSYATSSVPSLTLSRSLSFTHNSKRQPYRASSHAHSASTSVLEATALDSPSTLVSTRSPFAASSHPNWVVGPTGNDDNIAALSVVKNGPQVLKHGQTWTGEWNCDMQDVIKALRNLR